MSAVGFDLGNQRCVVAVAKQSGIIDVVLNDKSKHETPTLVCFSSEQRYFGTTAAAINKGNLNDTIVSQIKSLIGRLYSDPELQQDLNRLPFSVTQGPDGYPLIIARYLGETRSFTPTEVMGMVFTNMKRIAEKNLNEGVVDCCIGIPVYFTDLQRRAVMDAAKIAGLNPLRLMHETTATALAYGVYKTDLPENEQLNVAFVDIGHTSMQVCIAGFKKGQLKILAHAYDRCLGGRDFDEALLQHFAEKFKSDYKIDVFQNATACIRLRAACEELKKDLGLKYWASLDIKKLMEDKDVSGYIWSHKFEEISTPILERVKTTLEKALSEAQLTVADVYAVEIVGSGSRVPAVINILKEFFGKEPMRTMNESEGVSKGCALECAILSQTFKDRKFQVQESFPVPIAMTWEGSAQDSQNGNTENQQSTSVFPKGNPIPSVKALTFYRADTFTVDLQYADFTGLQAPAKISTYTIGPFQSSKGERSEVKVKALLNLHGIVSVESAQLIEEEEIDVPVAKETTKLDLDKASAMHPAQMETTDTKVVATKTKVKKSNIPVSELVYGGMLPADVQKATKRESDMALQDSKMEDFNDKSMALEIYVHDMKRKLDNDWLNFATDAHKEAFSSKLQETESWVHNDLFRRNETKKDYEDKLEVLQKLAGPLNTNTSRERKRKFYPNPAMAVSSRGHTNIKLHQGEGSSSCNPRISDDPPTIEQADRCDKQIVLVRGVIGHKREYGKYPPVDSDLQEVIDEYINIHRRVKAGIPVELFPPQLDIYGMVLDILEGGIFSIDPVVEGGSLISGSDSEREHDYPENDFD